MRSAACGSPRSSATTCASPTCSGSAAPETDVYLVPANWPSPRRQHWQTLLQARAIENQAYVVGCNRVGTAGDGTEHVGDSRIVSPMGELLATAAGWRRSCWPTSTPPRWPPPASGSGFSPTGG